jgi:thymidylate synthase
VGLVKDLGPAYYELYDDDLRLLYLNRRTINPFFALAEFSWIICGSNNLKSLEYFIGNFSQYSDDKKTLNGAYGYRLIHYFGIDQIQKSIDLLRSDLESRRCVLTTWSPSDLGSNSRDIPCNTSVFLNIRDQKLDITVLNRSNDLYLGVPYNIFIFFLLQKHIAKKIGISVGTQRHFSNTLHLYKKDFQSANEILFSNNKKNINFIKKKLACFDLDDFVDVNHKSILDLDFNNINNHELKNFFISFRLYKDSGNIKEALKYLPNNILGFIGYQWFRHRRFFSQEFGIDSYENILKEMSEMNSDGMSIQIFKYKTTEEIQDFISSMADKYSDKYNDFVSIIQENQSLFSLNESDKSLILKAIFLSLILASVGSNLLNPLSKDLFVQKFTELAKKIGLTYSDLVRITQYESKLLDVIDS